MLMKRYVMNALEQMAHLATIASRGLTQVIWRYGVIGDVVIWWPG